MLRFILIRLLQAIPVLFIIATITFFMVRLAPGGPFTEEKTIPVEIRKKMEEHYGLDRPLWEQYLLYFGIISKEVDKHRLEFAEGKTTAEFSPENKKFTITATRQSVVTATGQSPGQWHSRIVPKAERASKNHEVFIFRRERSGFMKLDVSIKVNPSSCIIWLQMNVKGKPKRD